jgi:hypothetical protein
MEGKEIGQVVLLCGVQGCCPTAEFTADGVVLRDDHGGSVRLTSDEWAGFLAKAKSGELG